MNIAIIAFTNPFVNKSDGGKIDIYNRVLALQSESIKIDFYTLLKRDERKSEFSLDGVNLITDKINNKYLHLFNLYPLSVNNRYSKKFVRIMKDKKYDLVIYENANMIKYLDKKVINSKINYIRIHNIESEYRIDTFKSSFPRPVSFLEYIEGLKYRKIEKDYINKFNKFLFISKDEQLFYINKFPKYKHKFIWVPPVIECKKDINVSKIKNNVILFYGDMKVSHNLEGIKWFAKNVFQDIIKKKPNIILKIVGKISSKDKNYLCEISNSICVLGYVDNLDKVIEEATFVVAPIFHGAGVKIKVLHALSQGKILIATKKAVEGTDFNSSNLIISNTKEEYLKRCIDVLDDYKKYLYLIDNSIRHLTNNYSIKNQREILLKQFNVDCKEGYDLHKIIDNG